MQRDQDIIAVLSDLRAGICLAGTHGGACCSAILGPVIHCHSTCSTSYDYLETVRVPSRGLTIVTTIAIASVIFSVVATLMQSITFTNTPAPL